MLLGGSDFSEVAFPGVPEERKGLAVERNEGDVRVAVGIEVAEIQSHAGDEGAFFGERDARLERNLFELVAEVMEQKAVACVVGDEEVGAAIEIEVGNAYSHAFADVVSDAPLLRDILECAVALV